MSDKTNTLDKPLTIRGKIYGTFVKKHKEIIRYEIKGIGIDEAGKIFDKEIQKSNKLTNYGSLILFVMLLWGLRESFLDSASRSILIFGIYPVYKLVGGVILLILLYKMWKHHLYCYAYKEALQEERYKMLIERDIKYNNK